MTKAKKKRNATDITLRNNRARKKEIELLEKRMAIADVDWVALQRRVSDAEGRIDFLLKYTADLRSELLREMFNKFNGAKK